MNFITTNDKSKTIRNYDLDELYHTKAGAIVEALEKHARALAVWKVNNPIIFDVCSGLSYNAACAVQEIRKHSNNSLITIYLFEQDLDVLKANLELPDSIEYEKDKKTHTIESYIHFKNAIKQFVEKKINIYEKDNIKIIIVFGDFLSTIETVKELADFVFYAPFSPLITPKMWEKDVFIKLYSHIKLGGKLSTYSYARRVRDGLSSAGFSIQNGPVLGRRSPSIIALKS